MCTKHICTDIYASLQQIQHMHSKLDYCVRLYLYTLSKTSLASADSNPDWRSTLAIKQDVTGGSSDGCQLGVACSQASQKLVGLQQLKVLAPVHVGQGSSWRPAHACSLNVNSVGVSYREWRHIHTQSQEYNIAASHMSEMQMMLGRGFCPVQVFLLDKA